MLLAQRGDGAVLSPEGAGPRKRHLDVVFCWQVVNGLKQRVLKLEQQCKDKDSSIQYGEVGRPAAGCGLRAPWPTEAARPGPAGPLGLARFSVTIGSVFSDCLCSTCHLLFYVPGPNVIFLAKKKKVNISLLFQMSLRNSIFLSSLLVPVIFKRCFLPLVSCGSLFISNMNFVHLDTRSPDAQTCPPAAPPLGSVLALPWVWPHLLLSCCSSEKAESFLAAFELIQGSLRFSFLLPCVSSLYSSLPLLCFLLNLSS